jgi:hypothetical protein
MKFDSSVVVKADAAAVLELLADLEAYPLWAGRTVLKSVTAVPAGLAAPANLRHMRYTAGALGVQFDFTLAWELARASAGGGHLSFHKVTPVKPPVRAAGGHEPTSSPPHPLLDPKRGRQGEGEPARARGLAFSSAGGQGGGGAGREAAAGCAVRHIKGRYSVSPMPAAGSSKLRFEFEAELRFATRAVHLS